MRAQVSKKRLVAALSALERIIPSRSSNPLITAVHLRPTAQGLTLSGTSLEVDLRVQVPAEVDNEDYSPMALPAHLFAQVVKNMGGELIELERYGNSNELAIRAGGSDFKLQLGDVASYPELTFSTDPGVTLDTAPLLAGITAARYAASSEAFQAVFRGLLWSCEKEVMTIVGSDGFRLGYHLAPVPGLPDGSMIVPGRSVDEITRVLAGQDQVSLFVHSNVLHLRTADAELNVKLMDGDFPDWQRVIPKDFALRYKVPAAELSEAVTRVAVLADKNANNRVELHYRPGMMPSLHLSAEGDYGRAQNDISVHDANSDSDYTWGYNARYLLDALKVMTGEVTLEFSKPGICLLTDSMPHPARAVVVALRV